MGFAAELLKVRHRYGRSRALDDVSISIPSGCMAGLIGPDGVGKSTLLALIAGVRKTQSGTIHVLDQDISRLKARKELSPRIAYMPQGLGRNLYPTLSVRENLDFFGRLFGQGEEERQQRIAMLLDATGLTPFPDRPAGKLSGGMKQKLALCCALIHDPDLLILDEPTTGVDPLSRRQFWELIARIRERMTGMSVVVATAYMEEADQFDWLAAMNAGKVIATGTPAEIRGDAATLDEAFIRLLPQPAQTTDSSMQLHREAGPSSGQPAIVATHLTKRFDKFTAVDDVSFEIGQGEIFGFLGSNGCGKTTTMKMLTGLLEPTEGETRLFGEKLSNSDMQARQKIGYMSQGFSLYSELTVRQNLTLHAQIYAAPATNIDAALAEFELLEVAEQVPESLPLGIRQRLQLAVATIHDPRILILDEPTSGVDPIARDIFWQKLISLSRDKGVTIFISTHFMNEAERCDRISLMHAGRVLAIGTPQELIRQRNVTSLEDAFIAYLEDQMPETRKADIGFTPGFQRRAGQHRTSRLWAYAWRESLELYRDPIRLFFALAGPIILMLTIGYGISFDVDHIKFAVYDQDKSAESRQLTEEFSAIRQFSEEREISDSNEIETRMGRGQISLVLEIPDGFGKDLHAGWVPDVSVWIDGSMPFRAETARGYAVGIIDRFEDQLALELGITAASTLTVETRFLFNQAFKSANAIIPSVLMLILMLVPTIIAAIGVVREKETGTIANFRSTPVSRLEFLAGKQLPYIALAFISFLMLYAFGRLLFSVPFTGNLALFAVVSLVYVTATTGLGQFISTFTRTQVAAVFAAAIITIIPAVNFSGLIVPVSSLKTAGYLTGAAFPGAWYQELAVGSFVKSMGWSDIWPNALVLLGFALTYLVLSIAFLQKQER